MFFGSFVEIYIFFILEACRCSSRLPVPPHGFIVLTMQLWSGLFKHIENLPVFPIVDLRVGDGVLFSFHRVPC